MNKSKKKWRKALLIISIIALVIVGGGKLVLQTLRSKLEAKISGCTLENKNFKTVIDFEYVNKWIVVKAKVAGSDKEYPFIFDTGAQTVILDLLLDEIGEDNYGKISFGDKEDTTGLAFNNELVTLHSLSLGELTFSDIGTLTAKNAQWGMLNCISPYGIIGYNILQTCNFQIDYEKKQIILTDKVESYSNYEEIQWLKYEPASLQETPIIPAFINDSIQIDLFFDTGMRGGISLSSEKIYETILQQYPEHTASYKSKPALLIRGEANELGESLLYKSSSFSFGNNYSKHVEITIHNSPGGEFTGVIGNDYFEDYIITVDYQNRRVGFIPNQETKEDHRTSYGISYLPKGEKMIVSAIYDGFAPKEAGIQSGDEIHSINGVIIADLQSDTFCQIYRNEYRLTKPADSLLQIEIVRGDSIVAYHFPRVEIY